MDGGQAATRNDPELRAEYKSGSWETNRVKLGLSGHDKLRFDGEYYYLGHLSAGTNGIPSETYVRIFKFFQIQSFRTNEAHAWLESCFEEYYKQLTEYLGSKK